jgi:phage replication-related protein YjqB (UPF0714/DUF867 family)
MMRSIVLRDARAVMVQDAEMTGFPGDLLVETDEAAGTARDRAFAGSRHRADVQIDVARQIEATLARCANQRAELEARQADDASTRARLE